MSFRYSDSEDKQVLYDNWLKAKKEDCDFEDFLDCCTDEEREIMEEAFDEYGSWINR
jgi:hypothetical protein